MAVTSDALAWYDQHRRVLPFRGTHDPYRVWVSEIMLQQTRTETVGAYYARFLALFPDVRALANAEEAAVLKAWEGLGYYSRARNLHKAAKIVARELGGEFPRTVEGLLRLPGIGEYTAAAVASIAFSVPAPAMDGNLTRVISRLYAVREDVTIPSVRKRLHALAAALMPEDRPGDMNQALMDIAATICTPGTPDCSACPFIGYCAAYRDGDPDALPLKPVKTPPRAVDVAVALVTRNQRVLVAKRNEALLRGMYVYILMEGITQKSQVAKALAALGLRVKFCEQYENARHVFTHRVWNMTIWHFEAENDCTPPGCLWVDSAEHDALPIPTAVRAARAHVAEAIGTRE